MRAKTQLLLLLVGLCASVASEAVGPTATTEFSIRNQSTYKKTLALQARLDQYVCLSIRARLVPDGAHSLQVTIYDGLGNEVRRHATREIVSDASLAYSFCHSFDEENDAPGTWWYVVELDDEPLVSSSIEMRE